MEIWYENYRVKKIKVSQLNTNHEAYFVRIDPEDLSYSIFEILQDLADLSWLNKFDQESVRDSFQSRATKTCRYIQTKLIDTTTNIPLIDKAGEYIVSCLAKKALLNVYSHNDIPLTELIGRKISNNPSFDFYTEKDNLLTAGEAKYKKGFNMLYATLIKYGKKHSNTLSTKLTKYIKYGTIDEKSIWLLRYGFDFDDIDWLYDKVLAIDSTGIKFNNSIDELSEE